MRYKISEYAKLKRVQYRTVWNWVKAGKVKSERTETGGVIIIDDIQDDLIADFTVIITSFCARLYGLRRTKRKTEQLIKELEKDHV